MVESRGTPVNRNMPDWSVRLHRYVDDHPPPNATLQDATTRTPIAGFPSASTTQPETAPARSTTIVGNSTGVALSGTSIVLEALRSSSYSGDVMMFRLR